MQATETFLGFFLKSGYFIDQFW